jgi:dihydroneopterin aldolase
MQDKMILKGLRFYAQHGQLPAEKALGQWYQIDVELSMDLTKALVSDALEDTLNYAALYEVIKSAVQGPSLDLIEALAGRILDCCFMFSKVEAAKVCVLKPQAPLKGPLDYAAVEVCRNRQQWQQMHQ